MSGETGLGQQSTSTNNYNVNINRATHNDGHRPLGDISNLLFTKDTNTQFTIKQHTTFTVYAEDTFTSPVTPVTGNDNYPNNTAITYYKPHVIFQNADVQITIGVTSGFSSSNGNYYIYCASSDGTDASTKGNAVLAAETDAPTWSEQKLGWYHATHGKALGRYVVTSSVISSFMLYHGLCKERGYIQYAGLEYATTDNLIINRLSCDIDGKLVEYLEDVNLEFNGQGAGWYIPYVDETTGGVSFQAIASFSSGASSNQLDMLTTYDDEKKYCENGSKRGLGAVYFDGTTFDYIIQIDNKPKSYVYATATGGQTIATATDVVCEYATIAIDINSEVTTGTFQFTAKTSAQYSITNTALTIDLSGAATGEYIYSYAAINGSNTDLMNYDSFAAATTRFGWHGAVIIPLQKGDYYQYVIRQTTGNSCTVNTSGANTHISIREL